MRIRTLKPEFWDDEKLGAESDALRLAFEWTWSEADDSGVLRLSAGALRSGVWKHQDRTVAEAQQVLDRMLELGLLRTWLNGTTTYAAVTHFFDHQRVDHPSRTCHPPIPEDLLVELPASFQDGYSRCPRQTRETLATPSRESRETLATGSRQSPATHRNLAPRARDAGTEEPRRRDPPPAPQGPPKGEAAPCRVQIVKDPSSKDCKIVGLTAEDREAFKVKYRLTERALTRRLEALTDHCASVPSWYAERSRGGNWLATIRNWLAGTKDSERKDPCTLGMDLGLTPPPPPPPPPAWASVPVSDLTGADQAADIWRRAKELLQHRLTPEEFEQWIVPLGVLGILDDRLVLRGDNDFTARWIHDNYAEAIRDVLIDAGLPTTWFGVRAA